MSRITFKKTFIVFSALVILAAVLYVLITGVPGVSDITSQEKGPSTGISGYGDSGVRTTGPPYYSGQPSYPMMPVPTAVPAPDNVYTNLADRKVIMAASLQIETENHDRVVNDIRSLAAGAGGYVQSSSTYLLDKEKKQTTITIKVPAAQYEPCLAQIKAMGKVKSETSSGQDITRQYVDLSARLKNLQAEEKQLSDIMGMSKNVTEVLSVERELFRVRNEIETTQAELNYLGSLVDFSTITATVSEPQPIVNYDWGLDKYIRDASHAFVSMIGGLIVLTGTIIPVILYLAIVLAILYFVGKAALSQYRKWKQNRDSKPR